MLRDSIIVQILSQLRHNGIRYRSNLRTWLLVQRVEFVHGNTCIQLRFKSRTRSEYKSSHHNRLDINQRVRGQNLSLTSIFEKQQITPILHVYSRLIGCDTFNEIHSLDAPKELMQLSIKINNYVMTLSSNIYMFLVQFLVSMHASTRRHDLSRNL